MFGIIEHLYIHESIESECRRVASSKIGHQRSLKVTTQGHLRILNKVITHGHFEENDVI